MSCITNAAYLYYHNIWLIWEMRGLWKRIWIFYPAVDESYEKMLFQFLKKQILGYKQRKQIEICYSYTIGLVVNNLLPDGMVHLNITMFDLFGTWKFRRIYIVSCSICMQFQYIIRNKEIILQIMPTLTMSFIYLSEHLHLSFGNFLICSLVSTLPHML